MAWECPERPNVIAGEVEVGAFNFNAVLASSESLSGTPTVSVIGSTELTISSVTVSTASMVISGSTVSAGRAITYKVIGFSALTEYRLRATCDTNSSPARTKVAIGRFLCNPSS